MSEFLESVDAVEVRHVPPDPAILKAIGLHHNLESAIADLVDNSVDAEARLVRIRFVLQDGLLKQLLMIDDGNGMSEEEIDSAMHLARPKAVEGPALGHFGVGLQAASFSQASKLTVLSRAPGGAPQGRRAAREGAPGFTTEVLEDGQVAAAFDRAAGAGEATGTVVRWDEVHSFPASKDRAVTSAFLERAVSGLVHHLGLVFHRLLERSIVTIEIDSFDADTGEPGFPFSVKPIDPFAYARSGAAGYPKTLLARFGTSTIPLECHIWPGRSGSESFHLTGGTIDSFQGFYLYRHNRLLSAGGWLEVTPEHKRRRLARVAIDIEDHLDAFIMSAEKAGVLMTADLVHAVENAASEDGVTWQRFLSDSEEAFREANRRAPTSRPAVLEPGQGVHPRVKKALARELEFVEAEEPLKIKWRRFNSDDFLEVDRRERTLWLNKDYRAAILNGRHGGVNDAPILKALLFLLFEDVFKGAAYGPKDKDNAALWSEVLTAAALAEWEEYE